MPSTAHEHTDSPNAQLNERSETRNERQRLAVTLSKSRTTNQTAKSKD
ncbi:MAG: hypothetical protein AAF711_09750 [Planctomycetota bacterium]